jgi:aldehyde dehydrogenase family 7 protein A1
MTTVLEKNSLNPAIATFVAGGPEVGEAIVDSHSLPVVSFTGSCRVGRLVGQKLAARFARPILELGGNNAIFVHEDANLDMAIRATLFGSVGTCGQRCTTCRRLYVHEKHYDHFVPKLAKLYSSLKIGNPLEEGVLVGPLHTLSAVQTFEKTVAAAVAQGGKVAAGGKALHDDSSVPGPNYVQPTIIEISHDSPIVKEENFVPILYVMKYKTIDEAIELNNSVEQGLSAALFTNSLQTQFQWLGPNGADTGIANVNIPTNGAEIGGAFGGEKATGGGRESGSDAWKSYMRRQTNTINYSAALPLAQGVHFNI